MNGFTRGKECGHGDDFCKKVVGFNNCFSIVLALPVMVRNDLKNSLRICFPVHTSMVIIFSLFSLT